MINKCKLIKQVLKTKNINLISNNKLYFCFLIRVNLIISI